METRLRGGHVRESIRIDLHAEIVVTIWACREGPNLFHALLGVVKRFGVDPSLTSKRLEFWRSQARYLVHEQTLEASHGRSSFVAHLDSERSRSFYGVHDRASWEAVGEGL
jgi:hypothetical protein